jgi:uncharacterized protein
MQLARLDQIIGLKTPRGVVGFHAHNMQVAKLDAEAWHGLTSPSPAGLAMSEAESEIRLWNAEIDSEVKDIKTEQRVRSLAINVAQICNLKCTYCAAGGDGTFGDPMKEVDLGILEEQIRSLLSKVPSGEVFKFTFLGGEPLIAPEAIRSIARFARLQTAGRKIHLRFDIVTNATLVTPEIAEMLADLSANVTVSLDGPPEINDRNRPTRGGRGSTEKTMRGVDNLKAVHARLGSLSVASVFGEHNLDVVGTYRFLQPLGFDAIKFDFAISDKDEVASLAFVDGLSAAAELAWTLGGEAELRRISNFDIYFRILDGRSRISNHCGAGKTHLHSDSRGKITTCQWFSGDAKEEVGVGALLEAEKLADYADPLVERHDCGSCWARNLCGGGCMYVNKTKTGSKHSKDEGFCIRTRSIIAKGIEYYAEARYQTGQN